MVSTEKFLSDFGPIEQIEFSNGKKTFSSHEALSNTKENIYFLSCVKDTTKRNNDRDIVSKRSFVIDLDIRSWFRDNEGVEISDDEIKEIAKTLSSFLDDAKYGLSEWRYIVFSGNGLHIYYIGDDIENTDPKLYQSGVKKLYELFEEHIDCPYMTPDYACRNIARIMRLPDTINQKNGKRVEILYHTDRVCSVIGRLQKIGGKYLETEKVKRIEESKEKAKKIELDVWFKKLAFGKEWNQDKLEEKIALINTIPAYLVSQQLLPEFPLHHNGKNFINDKNGFTGFFYNDKTNTICNGGSHHYSWGDTSSCYTPLVLVNKFYGHEWKDTFDWFKNNFKIG